MPTVIAIDGALSGPDHAAISVLDRGFLYGDSAFEVLRTYDGQPFALSAHLERLTRSCERLGIPPADEGRVRAEVEAALAEAANEESYVRVVITRGETAMGLVVSGVLRPRRVVVVMPLSPQPDAIYEEGVEVGTVSIARALDGTGAAGAKASNYLPNILSLEQVRARGAYEAVTIASGGELLEGATSNLFVVKGGRVATPPLSVGILGGITRRVVFRAAARAGVPVDERLLFPPDLYGADEAFITSSLREIVPVVRADGVAVGQGVPGPVTTRLREAFREVARAILDEERAVDSGGVLR